MEHQQDTGKENSFEVVMATVVLKLYSIRGPPDYRLRRHKVRI